MRVADGPRDLSAHHGAVTRGKQGRRGIMAGTRIGHGGNPEKACTGAPLALIEVGANTGLNLLFDRYGYDYGAGPGSHGLTVGPTRKTRLGEMTQGVALRPGHGSRVTAPSGSTQGGSGRHCLHGMSTLPF